jgi:signal transduction histidine kinase
MLLAAGLTVLIVLAFAVPLAILIRNTVYQQATDALQEQANRVANYLRGTVSAPSVDAIAGFVASVSDESCVSVVLPSQTAIGCAPPDAEELAGGSEYGKDGHEHDGPPQPQGVNWQGGRLVTLSVLQVPDRPGSEQGAYVVRVYASNAELHSDETRWWLLLGFGSVGLLAIGILAAELLTRRLVRPLTDTAETAHRISAGDVAARAPTRGPREIAEVGAALNRLADRIDELIADERETVADLSHRLRTPLTVLRLDAEGLRDPVEAERIGGHVSDLERRLTAVIRAARRPQREGRLPSCDASAVVGERVRFWSALAEDQARAATVDLPAEPLPVRTAAEDLGAAVDALLENVIAHTPEGTAFAVHLGRTASGVRLTVTDDGPGIADESVVRGRSDRNSSGLGLDIARACAEASGGSMTIGRSPSGGARVTLALGSP